jgi:hypothetical protein
VPYVVRRARIRRLVVSKADGEDVGDMDGRRQTDGWLENLELG